MDMMSDIRWARRPTISVPPGAGRSGADAPADRPATLRPSPVRYPRGTVQHRTRRRFGPAEATLVDLRGAGGIEVEIEVAADVLCLSMAVEEVGGTLRLCGERGERARIAAHTAAPVLLAPGAVARGGGAGLRVLRHLVIELPLSACAAAANRRGTLDDAGLARLCHLVADALADAETVPAVYADGLGAGLVKRLGELSGARAEPSRGGLAPRQLRRVLDHLEANLAEDLALDAMADVAGLSTSHFSRAFKVATGLPPHRWLLAARCERAKALLVATATPLAEIALDVGFCDQAHFCRSFARLVGTSPGAFRRAYG